jgi:hypothetical protein
VPCGQGCKWLDFIDWGNFSEVKHPVLLGVMDAGIPIANSGIKDEAPFS